VSIAPSSSSNYTGCSQESGFNFNGAISTKNQIAAAGYAYDSAGNLIAAPPTGTAYVYDAENHLISTSGQTYLYDGDGKRVEKATTGTPLVPNKLYWYGTDNSPVIETDANGNELYRYFRFGGLLVAREGGTTGSTTMASTPSAASAGSMPPTTLGPTTPSIGTSPTTTPSAPNACSSPTPTTTANSPAKNATPNPATTTSAPASTPPNSAASCP
jgi:hypothetical protein